MNIRQISRTNLYGMIRVFSLGALFFAAMLAVDYYFVAHTFCAEGAQCAQVAQSDFGQKYGIYFPALGLLAYSFFFFSSCYFSRCKKELFGKSVSTFWLPLAIICCAIGAVLFILVQAIEIHAFCWLCMGVDTNAILLVIPAVLLMMNERKGKVAKSRFHPCLWIAIYLALTCGPIAWGTRPQQAPAPQEEVAANSTDTPAKVVVPDYIQSFYKPGKINVVEISSFDCPHCRKLHPELSKLLLEYGERINFTRLTIPLGKQKEACVAYYCAEKQKKETEFADCMFTKPSKEAGQLLEYARQCSIDEESFKACLVDPASSQAIDEMLNHIRNIGFEGAPTIWINDRSIVGYDEKAGMAPYRAALGNVEYDDPKAEITKTAFQITRVGVFAGAILLLLGIFKTVTKKKPRICERNEEKSEEKPEDKSEEKSEDKSEEKSEDKSEEKSEDKSEEKPEDKSEEKSEDKSDEKSEDN